MKKYFSRMPLLQALQIALIFALLFVPVIAKAQVAVTKQPQFVASVNQPLNNWVDLGNGPTEVLPIEGNGQVYTATGNGVGSASASTTLTLTATPAVPPCIGCQLTGTGITVGTTVAAYNGTTTITMSASMTVPASTPIIWGAACPTSGSAAGQAQLGAPANVRAGTEGYRAAIPFNTGGRICVTGGQQSGLTFTNFTIGAW